jgi:hypothetical protein
MAIGLDEQAWTWGEAPDEWPRSRYTGVALYPGHMAITLIVSWQELFGHSYIAFEWFAEEVPAPRTRQRRHEVYHLRAEPTDGERARGVTDPGCLALLAWRPRPARVVVETDPQFFPLRDAGGRRLPAYYRSWLVPFADGWRARSSAAMAVSSPPRYNYLELGGGQNCARWVLGVAAVAGIDARHRLCSLVAIPKCLVRRAEALEEEGAMWQRRRAGLRSSGQALTSLKR